MYETKKYLKELTKNSKNYFYITNLKEIVCIISNNSITEINTKISRDLLEILFNFSLKINDCTTPYFFSNKEVPPIHLFDKISLNINWKSQIIIPIYIDNQLFTSIIMCNNYRNFDTKDLKNLLAMTETLEDLILKDLNKNYKGDVD